MICITCALTAFTFVYIEQHDRIENRWKEPNTLLLLSVIHSDFKYGRPLTAQQCGSAGGGVQLVNAATAVLVPEQEVLIVAQTKGVVQLLAFVHSLAMTEHMLKTERQWKFL